MPNEKDVHKSKVTQEEGGLGGAKKDKRGRHGD